MIELNTYTIDFQIPNELTIYGFTGKIAHASILAIINQTNPELAEKLHEGNERRTFVVSSIHKPKEFNKTIGRFTVTTANAIVKQTLQHIFQNSTSTTLNILNHQCQIVKVAVMSEFINGKEQIQENTNIRIRFLSPTFFSTANRKAKTDPYPSLDRMWNSMVETWNFLAGEQLGELNGEFTNRLLKQINTPSFDLKSTHIRLSHRIKVTGFTGMINLTVENTEGLQQLLPLLKLTDKWGIGSKRTIGFGRVNINIRYPTGKKTNAKSTI